MRSLNLDFMKISVHVDSRDHELLDRLAADFSHFVVPDGMPPLCRIEAHRSRAPEELASFIARKPGKKSKNCRSYRHSGSRINDYFGEGLVHYDFRGETGRVYSESLHRLHELCYLLILSRVGKYLDRQALHRIHAMAVVFDGKKPNVLVSALPSGVGKTTLLLELLKSSQVRILSDDSPLVDRRGNVYPFSLRLGLTENALGGLSGHPAVDSKQTYPLERMRFGKKHLLPLTAISREIAPLQTARAILLTGRRGAGSRCLVKKTSRLKLVPHLLMEMVIGRGLPMMREYFIEDRPADFLVLAKILFSRIYAAIALLARSVPVECVLTHDPAENVRAIQAFLTELSVEMSENTAISNESGTPFSPRSKESFRENDARSDR